MPLGPGGLVWVKMLQFSCASASADTIQTRDRRLKMLILNSQKFHRTKVPSSKKWGKGPLF